MQDSPDDDGLISQLEAARAFVEGVRRTQNGHRRPLTGSLGLPSEQCEAIEHSAHASSLVHSVKQSLESELPLKSLFERFEAMCRRQDRPIQPALRPAVQKLLAAELWANSRVFGLRGKDLVSVTLYEGEVTDIMRDKPPNLWRRAVKNAVVAHPTNPRGQVRKVQDNLANLIEDPEFADFRESATVFQAAAIDHPNDPQSFLRTVKREIAALIQEEEFADFRKSPSILRIAATDHPKDPRSFLRKIGKVANELAEDKEFTHFRSSPNLYRLAAMSSSSDPRAFLTWIPKLAPRGI